MKNFIFLLCSVMVLLTSCSNDMPEIQDNVTQRTGIEGARESLYKILAQPAIRQINTHPDNPLGLAKVAKGTSYGKHGQELTRSEEDSAMYYVFRFDNGGFAVIGAQPNMPELLAYSPGPALGNDSTGIYFPPFGGGHEDDPIWYGDGSKVYGTPTFEWITNPNYIELQWGQGAPFNMYVGGGDIATGCLPTAIAMFMGSDKYRPSYYNGYTFEWNKMLTFISPNYYTDIFAKETAKQQIARLMQCLGAPQNLNATYGTKTSASVTNISRTLQNFGFSNVGMSVPYNITALKNELTQGYPVIMWGEEADGNAPHAWICSGLCKETVPWSTYTTKPTPDTCGEDIFYLYYFNLGWNGFNDGLYIEQFFNFDKGPKYANRNKQDNNYNVNVSMHIGARM